MLKRLKVILLIVIVLVLLQFIPVEKPIVIEENKNDLISNNVLNDTLISILRNACYDCHSYETNLPWYSSIFPSSLLVSVDTKKGRDELNFSEWEDLRKLKKLKNLKKIEEEVLSGEMPMRIYLVMHPEAKLSEKDKEIFVTWVNEYSNSLLGK